MSQQGLPVSSLINVTVTLTPAGASFQNIDSELVLGSSDRIDVTTRMEEFSTLTEVGAVFETTDPEYLAATLWFGQSPAPQSLFIGEWAEDATSGQLFGAPLSAAEQLLSVFTAITSGSFECPIDGVAVSVTGMNFSAAESLNGVAAVIQTAVRAASATVVGAIDAVVIWSATNDNFEFQSGSNGAMSMFGFLNPPTATGFFAFSGNPSNADTITLNGTAVEFVTGAPVGSQVQLGGSLALTLGNLLVFLNESVDAQIVKFSSFAIGAADLYLAAAAPGTGGDALTLAKSSSAITVSGATLSGATGTDISNTLGGRSTDSGSYVAPGIAAETALEAVEIFDQRFSSQWYALFVCGAADGDDVAIAGYIEGDTSPRHFYAVNTQEEGVLVATDTSDVAYQLQQLDYDHTATQFSSENPYAVNSMMARILTTDWQGSNTTINLMYKQEPGVVPENLSTPQAASVTAKNCNVYVDYNNGTAILQRGVCASGEFVDTIIGLDWLANQIQTNVYNALYTTTTKVPQTDPGENVINQAIQAACSQGVTNGLLAPGVWNSGGFGQLVQGGYLSKGYYIYQPPVALQPENLRAERQSVAFQVAVKLAGAVDDVSIAVLVNQ